MASSLVSMLLFLALCACVLGETVSTTPSPTPSSHVYQRFRDVLNPCVQNITRVKEPDVICARVPEVDECLQEAEGKWDQTHSDVEKKVFAIYKELWVTTSKRLCQNQGQELSDLIQAYEIYRLIPSAAVDLLWTECFFYGSMVTVISENSDADLPTKLWYKYLQIQHYEKCFNKYMDTHENFLKHLSKLASDTLDIMKCLRPQDEEIVLCKDMDLTLIDRENVCTSRSEFAFRKAKDSLVKKTVTCLKEAPLGLALSEAQTLEQTQRYFQNYCTRTAERFLHCQCATGVTADICLLENDYEKFKLIRFYIDLVHDTGCIGGGRMLATLFHRFKVVNNATGAAETGITDCLKGTLVDRSGSLDVNGYYNELPTIRQCLLDAMPEETGFESELNSMYDRIRNRMKCLNPDDGKVALCKDLF